MVTRRLVRTWIWSRYRNYAVLSAGSFCGFWGMKTPRWCSGFMAAIPLFTQCNYQHGFLRTLLKRWLCDSKFIYDVNSMSWWPPHSCRHLLFHSPKGHRHAESESNISIASSRSGQTPQFNTNFLKANEWAKDNWYAGCKCRLLVIFIVHWFSGYLGAGLLICPGSFVLFLTGQQSQIYLQCEVSSGYEMVRSSFTFALFLYFYQVVQVCPSDNLSWFIIWCTSFWVGGH